MEKFHLNEEMTRQKLCSDVVSELLDGAWNVYRGVDDDEVFTQPECDDAAEPWNVVMHGCDDPIMVGVGARHPFNKPDTWSGLSVACDLDNNGSNTHAYSKPEGEKTETGRSKLCAVWRQISEKIGEKIKYYEKNHTS